MTATYDIDTAVGKVRLTIGDTILADAKFTDEEIDYFLSENSSNINMAASDALRAWAASYGQNAASENLGDYSYTQRIIENMLKLAARLRENEQAIPAGAIAEVAQTDFAARDIIYNKNLRTG